jgi:hypothetical protein
MASAAARSLLLLITTMVAAPALAAPAAGSVEGIDVAAARASLAGAWTGSLEYLDYTANKWFGIPVKTVIEDQGDGATMLRKSDFDDGPVIGMVRITSTELYDAKAGTVTTGTFRKGRAAELVTYSIRMDGVAGDSTHWVLIEESLAKDNNRPALLRLTTTRNGDRVETLKEVDFQDDDKVEWLQRNRTRLTRITAE